MTFPKLNLTDIAEVTLNSTDDTALVNIQFKVGDELVEWEELIEFGKDTPEYLKDASLNFCKALLKVINEKSHRPKENACETCTGACCHDGTGMGIARVTLDDVNRLQAALGPAWVDENVVPYGDGGGGELSWTGHVGYMKRVKNGSGRAEGEEKILAPKMKNLEPTVEICVALRENGCSVYEHRPQVCRDFSNLGCSEWYQEDPKKITLKKAGKTVLRVVT